MSRETVQFVEIVREAVKVRNTYQLYCHNCGKVTDHVYLGRSGMGEQYQCKCGLIYTAVTR